MLSGLFEKLVHKCNNSYLCTIGKRPIYADYSALSEEFESSYEAPKFKTGNRVTITMNKKVFREGDFKKIAKRNICD